MKKLLFIILSITIVISSVVLVRYFRSDLDTAIETNTHIQELVLSDEDLSDPLMDPSPIDFDTLMSINEDVYGWIYVPGTVIDYPILADSTDQYYLWRDIYKEPSKIGSIFTPRLDSSVDLANLLVFGHRIVGASEPIVFSHLGEYYKDLSTGLDHQYAYVYRPDTVDRYLLVGLLETDETDPIYQVPYILGSDDYSDLLDDVSSRLIYTNPDSLGLYHRDNPILVLSACRGRINGDQRTVAVFVLD